MEENRMIGKTTRTVDHAIQMLFTEGTIHVPTKSEIKDENYQRGRNKNQMIIDPDWEADYAQKDLLNRIVKRLRFEHRLDGGSKLRINGTTLYLNDPKFVKDGVQ